MDCEKCIWTCEQSGVCTAEDCIDGSAFAPKTPQLKPEDAFKALYILIYMLGGEVTISKKSFDDVNEAETINPSYDHKTDSFVLETSRQPPPIRRKRGIIKPKRRIFIPT